MGHISQSPGAADGPGPLHSGRHRDRVYGALGKETTLTPSKAPLRFLGTWRITKVETSRPDLPHPTTGVTTFTQEADHVHYEAETTWSDGTRSKVTAALRTDGSWCPVIGSLIADTVSFQRVDDSSFSVNMKKQGLDVGTNHTTISATGRTMTGSWEVKAPDGTKVTWKMSSERQ